MARPDQTAAHVHEMRSCTCCSLTFELLDSDESNYILFYLALLVIFSLFTRYYLYV